MVISTVIRPRVYPSGAEDAIACWPTTPEPPVRFTTLTGCLSSFSSRLPMMRAVASVPPPAPQGTMSWIGRCGYWAKADDAANRNAASSSFRMTPPPFRLALANRQHQRLEHVARRAVLHERGHPEVLRVGAAQERQGALLLEFQAFAETDRADPFAHHEIVLEALAAVLAGGDLARELVLVGGQVYRGIFFLARIDQHRGELGVDGPPGHRADGARDPRARGTGIDARHALRQLATRPAAEVLPLQQHLRGVDARRALHLREPARPRGKFPFREGVFPADVVPVVDVKRKRHHLTGPESLGEERREPMIRRRAGIAALRRIQLDQRRGMRPAVGRARRIGGARGEGKGKGERGRHRCKGVFRFHAFFRRREGFLPYRGAWYTQRGRGSFAAAALGL